MKLAFLMPLLIFVVGCSSETQEIGLGMDKSDVVSIFDSMGIEDTSSGMQTFPPTPEGAGWMWYSERHNLSIETKYSDDNKLTDLFVWDWENRSVTSYHHMLEYHEVSSLVLSSNGDSSYVVIVTHNEGSH